RVEWIPQVQQYFSEDPPDVEGVRAYLEDVKGSAIRSQPLFILGDLQLEMKAQDFLNFYYLLDDRTLVDAVPHDIVSEEELDTRISFDYLPGLEEPLKAALSGVEDQNLLYETVEPGNRITGAVPVFRFEPRDFDSLDPETNEPVMDVERKLVGVIVFTTKRFPWEYIPIGEIMLYIGRSLLIFTFFAGILGSIFGMITANSLTKRLSRLSQAAHDWSQGKFSVIIRETMDDEIGQLASDLNRMADQLESLLDRRQEISVLEERNRLARDLHDSVKQQAFAASAQLAAAKAHFEQDPEEAFLHLQEAEQLIEKVRQELTSLIKEMRPIEMKGKGLLPAVEDLVNDWKRRNPMNLQTQIQGKHSLPLEMEKGVFRIVQEALANISWHSQAENVNLMIDFQPDFLSLVIKDDGKGFVLSESSKSTLGLQSMHERAVLIGGELIINSQPGQGTEIILTVPYQMMEI
ncbi:MAG: sensor histidine kinase, partial [Chloroflexota bacterium]|nr:sensor histidine kinase [Chloroflexota bacterium]